MQRDSNLLGCKYEPIENLDKLWSILEVNDIEFEQLIKVNRSRFPESSQMFLTPQGEIMCASETQLLIYLCRSECPNEFQNAYIFNITQFSTPKRVLAGLLAHFFIDINLEKVNIRKAELLATTRGRISTILCAWAKAMKCHWNSAMINTLKAFEQLLIDSQDANVYHSMVFHAIQYLEEPNQITSLFQLTYPEPVLPTSDPRMWSLLDIPPIEVARQITIYHFETFSLIQPFEILDHIWNNKPSPHMDELSEQFNRFSSFVSLSILMPSTPQERGEVHAHWLNVASEFYKLNNFHGLFAIIYGLTHRSVDRLTKTVASSLTHKSKQLFSELKEFTAMENDFAKYRNYLLNVSKPCIPYIGLFIKDLIYVHESIPNKIHNLVNWEKCKETAKVLLFLKRFQKQRYVLKSHEHIQSLIKAMPKTSADTAKLMQISMLKEPKMHH